MNTKNRILVIGGTGSWGQALVRYLLDSDDSLHNEITIFSRAERTQYEMKESFKDSRLRFEIGDVRDEERLAEVIPGHSIIFYLAALKHVPVCEDQPFETFKTNVQGVENALKVVSQHEDSIFKFIYLSTDKAVEPVNTYGISKAMAERFVEYYHNKSKTTHYQIVRTGNILGSNGSIFNKWVTLAKEGKPLQLTDRMMTRYMSTLSNMIPVLAGIIYCKRELINILPMKSFYVSDLATIIANQYGSRVEVVGLREGERMFEKMDHLHNSSFPEERGTKDELYELIKDMLV